MLNRLKRNIRAVTLFEMLLVLLVSGMIMLAAFKYEQTEKEKDAANALADRMYIFSQTVRTFVVNNRSAMQDGTYVPVPAITSPSSYAATGTGANKQYVFKGVSWLTNPALTLPNSTTPYLPASFSFDGLSPLQLRRNALVGDDVVEVTVSGNDITILYGDLYDARDTTKPPQLRGAMSAVAAKEAATRSDPMLGPSVFAYTGGVDAQGNPVPITARLIASTSVQTQINNPTIAGALDLGGATTAASDDGTIKNVESIEFSQGIAGMTTGINGLNKINFSMQGPAGAIENLNKLNFQKTTEPSTILNLNLLTFSDEPDEINNIENVTNIKFKLTGGSLTNVTNLTFKTLGGDLNNVKRIGFVNGGTVENLDVLSFSGTNAKITGLRSIEFGSNQEFAGFRDPIFFEYWYDTNNHSQSGNFRRSLSIGTGGWGIELMKTKDYICSLSYARHNDGSNDNDRSCKLIVSSGVYFLVAEKMQACGAMCIKYAP